MHTDTEACLRAVRSRDERFDGWFFTAVRTTGIYCRPSCPAMTPKAVNVEFFPSAAAAQRHGYRACKRCRPDASPGSPQWCSRADLVARAMRMIGDGVVDREGVTGLAARLGYSVRQVERQVRAELGAGPLALARAQRAQTARTLVERTDLPLTEVAFAAGFGSIRAFNHTVQEVFGVPPRALRDRAPRRPGPDAHAGAWHRLRLRLWHRQPFCADTSLGHLVSTAVPGVEEWADGAFRRSLDLPFGPAVVSLRPLEDHVETDLWLSDLRDLTGALSRCRFLLDLDADPTAVDELLAADPLLRESVLAHPGRRALHSVDPDEIALRVVLGQQVSTAAARTVTGRLVQQLGTPLETPIGSVTHLFPRAAALADVDPRLLPMPTSRKDTLRRLAACVAQGELDLGPGADRKDVRSRLGALKGVGPWTVEMIAMRALGDPDAFPAADLGLLAGARALGLEARLGEASRPWVPWRATAAQHLWAATDHPAGRHPDAPAAATEASIATPIDQEAS